MFLMKKKYTIRYSHAFNNSPFNTAFYCLGKPSSLAKKGYERIKIWTKENKLNEFYEKSYLTKEDILSSCHFPSQREELDKILKG